MIKENSSTTSLNKTLINNDQIDDYENLIVRLKKIKNIIKLFEKAP